MNQIAKKFPKFLVFNFFKVDKVDKVEIRSIKSKNKVENILDEKKIIKT